MKSYAAILVKNINWDVDDSLEAEILPNEVVITDDIENINDVEEDKILDYLSNKYEFCINSFDIVYLSPEELYKRGAIDFVKWFSEEIGDISTDRKELFVANGNKWEKAINVYLKEI